MTRALLTLLLLLSFAPQAHAIPSYATLSGTVRDNDGSACSMCDVTIRTAATQAIGGETFPQEPFGTTYTTDVDGDLPAGVFVARTLIVGITIAHAPNEIRVRIPDSSAVDIASLVLPPVAPPVGCTGCIVSANIASGAVTASKIGAVDTPADEECLTYEATGTTLEWQTCGSGGSGYATVMDEGAALTARTTLDFAGAGVTCADSGGTKTLCTIPGGSGAPSTSKYILQAADGSLPNAQSLGALTTGLLLNTASAGTGVLSQYAGASCGGTGFIDALNNSGAGTCTTVAAADMAASSVVGGAGGTIQDGTVDGNDLATGAVDFASGDVTGIVPIAKGGTGVTLAATGGASFVLRQSSVGANVTVSQLSAADLSNGTTGTAGSAVVLATSPTIVTPTIASFANATHNHTNAAGGGTLTLAGAAFPNQGTTTTVLHGNAAGNPSWTSIVAGDMAASSVVGGAAGTIQDGTVDGNDLAAGAVDFASGDVTGIVPIAKGGTGVTLAATGGASQVLRQSSVGANVTVSQLSAADLSNGTTGTAGSAVVLTTSPTIVTPTIASFANATHNHTSAAGGGTLTLAGAAFPNQGTTATLLHGNAAGNPSWTSVVAADMAASSVVGGAAGTISDNTITADDLAVDSVTGSELADSAIDDIVGKLDAGYGVAANTATSPDTLDFAPSEVGTASWGGGGSASYSWTFSLSGANDPVLTFANNFVKSEAPYFQIGNGSAATVSLFGSVTGLDPEIDFTAAYVNCANCRFTMGAAEIPDINGTPSSGQVPYWNDADTLKSEAAFAYDDSTNTLTAAKLIGGSSPSGGLTLQSTSSGTRGTVTVEDKLLVGDDVPDQTTGILNVVAVTPTVDITGMYGMVNGYAFAPTTTMSGTLETLAGYRLDPSVTVTSSAPLIRGLYMGGTITNSYAPSPSALPVYQVNAATFAPTLTSSTANGGLYQDAYVDQAIVQYTGTGNVTTALNPWAPISFLSNPSFTTTNSGDLSIDQIFSLYSTPQIGTLNASSSLNVTDMATVGFVPPSAYTGNISAAGSTITNYYGMYGNLTTTLPTNLSITNAYGIKLTAWDKATNNYSLYSDSGAATLYNGGRADIGDGVADVSSGVRSIVDVSPTIDVSGGSLNGYVFAPTTTLSGILNYTSGIAITPTISHNVTTLGALIYGVNMVGTLTATGSGALSSASILNHNTTYTSATASAAPITNLIAVVDIPTVSSSATSGTATPTNVISVQHNPTISRTGAGTMTLGSDIGLQMDGTYTESAGTLNVTNRIGFKFNEVTNTSSATAVTNNIGVDIAALSTATTNIGIRNADTTVYTPTSSSGLGAAFTIDPTATVIEMQTTGNNNRTSSTTTAITNGVAGQVLILVNVDSDSNTITMDGTGGNLNLSGAADYVMGINDTLTVLYSNSKWVEIGRSNN